VTTGRATIIDVGEPLTPEDARAWLAAAGEDELEDGLRELNRALHVFRVVTADPHLRPVRRGQALVARIGYGAGDEVADGRWSEARELVAAMRRQRRSAALHPQALLAGVLTGQERVLACQELTLRARLDLDEGRPREAALQLLVALDAALAELPTDARAANLTRRIEDLRGRRDATARAAQAALAGPLDATELESVTATLGRIEAALRARAVASS
jgi:hypothetical protein